MFPENWHFNSRFVLKTTKTSVHSLFSLLRFFDKIFDVINDDPFLMLQKDSAIYEARAEFCQIFHPFFGQWSFKKK